MDNYITANKIFYHYDRIDDFVNGRTVKPISIKMRLTDICNLNCYYCSYKGKLTNNSIDFGYLPDMLEKLKMLGVKSIVLTGGEPTCYDFFEEAVIMMKEEFGFDIGLITNGVIFPNVLEYLTWIRFSLDTVNENTYYLIKGVNLLEDTLSTIDKTVKTKKEHDLDITIGIQTIINKENFDYQFKEVHDIIAFAESINVDYLQIRPLENYNYDINDLKIIDDNLNFLKLNKHKVKIIYTDYKWNEVKNGYRKLYKGCPAANFIGMIDVFGDYYICCAMTNDKTAKYGNLLTNTVEEILTNRKEVLKKFDYSKCTAACQGSLLNQTLDKFKNIKHINFI